MVSLMMLGKQTDVLCCYMLQHTPSVCLRVSSGKRAGEGNTVF